MGRPAYINLGREGVLPGARTVEVMREATWAVLDAAYGAGIRWVDVARSYGRAEEFLAGWLHDRGFDDVTVSSKWGYAYVGGWRTDADVHEVKEHSLARFTQQWGESRALLGGRIALYQVHSLTLDSPLFDDKPLLEALAGLAAEGVRVGFSTSGPTQADVVQRGLALQVAGQPVFTAVQSTWNLLEPSVGSALAQAHDTGALVMLKETLANGRLAATPPPALVELAGEHATTPDAVAIAAAMSHPWADTVLTGAVTPEQLASNLQASTLQLSDHDHQRLAELAEPPKTYWSERSALPWR